MTKESITPATKGQVIAFDRLLEDALREVLKVVALDKDSMQRLLGNGGKFQEGIIALVANLSASDNRFRLLNKFMLRVPKGYKHATQLTTFAEHANGKIDRFFFCSSIVTDANYDRATQQLVPGKSYGVKIFLIKQRVTSEDCLAFLDSQRAILVGAQGLSLARQLRKKEFPAGEWTVSFDKKEALWQDASGDRRVPFVSQLPEGNWEFDHGSFEEGWDAGDCFICFCDLYS
jgi:hypothetical protein